MRIIFFGTAEFSSIILEELIKGNYKPVLVVASPDKPVGRDQILTPPAAKAVAEKYSIPVIQPEVLDADDFKKVFINSQPDAAIVAAYGPPFIPKELLSVPQYGCLNVHPSLLPKYRGASPIPHQILAGEKETGVTVIRLSEKVDQGDILSQEKSRIETADTTRALTEKLALFGGRLLAKTLPLLAAGRIVPQKQPAESPTPYCRQLKKEDGKIDWLKFADHIERQVRAFDPWPGVFTLLDKKILKIMKARVINITDPQRPAGSVFLNEGKLLVQAGKNSLEIITLQLEGKKPLSAEEFLRGRQDVIGKILN